MGGMASSRCHTCCVCHCLSFNANVVTLRSERNFEKRSAGPAVLREAFPEAMDHGEMRVCHRQTRSSQVPIIFGTLAAKVQATYRQCMIRHTLPKSTVNADHLNRTSQDKQSSNQHFACAPAGYLQRNKAHQRTRGQGAWQRSCWPHEVLSLMTKLRYTSFSSHRNFSCSTSRWEQCHSHSTSKTKVHKKYICNV